MKITQERSAWKATTAAVRNARESEQREGGGCRNRASEREGPDQQVAPGLIELVAQRVDPGGVTRGEHKLSEPDIGEGQIGRGRRW